MSVTLVVSGHYSLSLTLFQRLSDFTIISRLRITRLRRGLRSVTVSRTVVSTEQTQSQILVVLSTSIQYYNDSSSDSTNILYFYSFELLELYTFKLVLGVLLDNVRVIVRVNVRQLDSLLVSIYYSFSVCLNFNNL